MSQQSANTTDKQAMSALKQHGGTIVMAILLVLAGYFGWEYYQKNYAKVDTVAADMYTAIDDRSNALRVAQQNPDLDAAAKQSVANDEAALFADIDQLVAAHGDTVYAWQALMIKARQQTDANDLAGAVTTLNQATTVSVIDEGLLAITKLRYAQAMLANGDADGALTVVNESMPQAFEASRQELLGDIHVTKNQTEQAKQAYAAAWEALRERQENRAVLTLKLQSLGVEVAPIAPRTPVVATPSQPNTSDANTTENITESGVDAQNDADANAQTADGS